MRAQDTTETVYHYTKKDAFVKIFAPGGKPELRMYPIHQMNDPMECKWILNNLKDYTKYIHKLPSSLASKLAKLDGASREEIKTKRIKAYTDSIEKIITVMNDDPPYLLSLSKIEPVEDGLSLWREYSVQGCGLSIKLDDRRLFTDIVRNDLNLSSGCVVYDEKGHSHSQDIFSIFDSLLVLGLEFYLNTITREQFSAKALETIETQLSPIFKKMGLTPEDRRKRVKEFWGDTVNIPRDRNITLGDIYEVMTLTFFQQVQYLSAFIKQYAYYPEKEVRIIQPNDPHKWYFCDEHPITKERNEKISAAIQVDQDSGKTYYPIPLILGEGQSLVREIIIGPNCILSAMDVKMILKECNPALANVAVRKSQIYMVKKY